MNLALVGVHVHGQRYVVPFVTLTASGLRIVQLFPSLSATNVFPSSLILPVTLPYEYSN
jgi:hypothetical protein